MATKRNRIDPEVIKRSTAELQRVRRHNQTRDDIANIVTVIMLLLTLLIVAWVAYQINNPIDLCLRDVTACQRHP